MPTTRRHSLFSILLLISVTGVILLGAVTTVALLLPQARASSTSPVSQENAEHVIEVLRRIGEASNQGEGGAAAISEACARLSRFGDDELKSAWQDADRLPVSVASLCGGMDGSTLAGSLADRGLHAILGEGLNWVRGTGLPYLTRLELEGAITADSPRFSVMTIQPWYADRESGYFVFNQVSWQHETIDTDDGDADDTFNFGLAFRKLVWNDTLLLGVNTFVDHQTDQNHNRLSVGVDAQTEVYGLAANRYVGLSDWRALNALTESKALSGWDVEFSGRHPDLPEVTGYLKGFQWDALSGEPDVYGATASVEWTPVPALVFTAGVTDENQSSPQLEAGVRLRLNLEHALEGQFTPVTQLASMADRVFDRVRRENTIRTQVRTRASAQLIVTETSGANSAVTTFGTTSLSAGLQLTMPVTATVANSVGAIARLRFSNGALLTIGQGSQVLIEPGTVTLVSGTAQYISGSTSITVNVPGGTITLLGTDIDMVSNGTTSTVRVRDGSVRLVGSVSGEQVIAVGGMGQSVSGVVSSVAGGSGTYIAHGDDVSVKIDRIASPVLEKKAAPYPVLAPRIMTDATVVGQTVEFGLAFNVPVTVSGGTPHLTLSIGGNSRTASLVSGSGSDELIFGYVLQSGDAGQSVITVTGLDANAASVSGEGKQAITTIADTDLNLSGSVTGGGTDVTAPSGYAVAFTTDPINTGNETAAAFEMTSAEVGATYDYSISSDGGGTPVTGSGTISTATQSVTGIDVSGLADGTLTVSLTLTDPAGNTGGAATDTVSKDTAGATVTVTTGESDPTNNSPFAVTLTFSEAVSGLTVGELSVGNGSASNLATGDNITYTADITPSGDGAVTVQVPADVAQNGAGNGNAISNQLSITYDGTAPSGYAVAFTTDPINTGNETAAAFEMTSAEVGATYDYSISSDGGGTPVTGSGTISTATQSVTGIDVSGLADGTLTVSLTLTDTALNTGAAATDTVTKNTAPAGIDCTDPVVVASATPGDVCLDGSVYAGLSPDGSVPMFVTRCDLGQTWNGSSCTGTRSTLSWNDGVEDDWLDTPLANCTTASPNAAAACNEGQSNSAFLNTADSSSAAGTQPHLAAQACESLNEHGKNDWYLPSQGELYVMWQNRMAIENFNSTGAFYWTSSEFNNLWAMSIRYQDGFQSQFNTKSDPFPVRCARR